MKMYVHQYFILIEVVLFASLYFACSLLCWMAVASNLLGGSIGHFACIVQCGRLLSVSHALGNAFLLAIGGGQ
jgi:hypothetical protein